MTNSTFSIIGFVILVCFSSCSKENVLQPGPIETQIRELSFFDQIHISDLISSNLTYGMEQKVVLRAGQNIINLISTEVNNDVLTVDLKKGSYSELDIEIDIVLPKIESVQLTNVGKMQIQGFENLDSFSAELSGIVVLEMQGSSDKLILESNLGATFRGFEFIVDTCQIKHVNIHDSEIRVKDYVFGEVTNGRVLYKGNPEINVVASGLGKVIDAN